MFNQCQIHSASAKNAKWASEQRSTKVIKRGHAKVAANVLDEFRLLGSDNQPNGSWEKALKRYKQAQSSAPNSVETAYNIALCETHLHQYSAAEDSIKKAIRINPLFGPNFSLLAAVNRLQGKEQEAKDAEMRSRQL